MKIPFALLFISVAITNNSWSQDSAFLSGLNHIAAPVNTEIDFHFGAGLPEETRLVLRRWDLLDFLYTIDTTLQAGTKALSVSLDLERPLLLQLSFNSDTDELFVLPGRKLTVGYTYQAGKSLEKSIEDNRELQAINAYYEKLNARLGVKHIREAYGKYTDLPELAAAGSAFDSLSRVQLALLTPFEANLPSWFVQYEKNNIEYARKNYKLLVVSKHKHIGIFSGDLPPDFAAIINGMDTDDEVALLSINYLLALNEVSYLKHCGENCYTGDDASMLHLRSDGLVLGKEIKHEQQLAQALEDQAFLLVNICTNSSEAAWKATLERENMPGLNLYAKGNWNQKIERSYRIQGYPKYVLVDKEGKVILDKCPRPSSEKLIPEIRPYLE